jgi:endonuclease/exonuclease/phosphatase family metal-dependent hydrolase
MAARRPLFLAVFVSLLAFSPLWAQSEPVTVMQKNMDTGTDFGFFFSNLQTDPALGVQLTFAEIQKNDYPGRASLLAQEIAAAHPLVVGLEEATLLTSGPDPTNTPNVLVDQLQLLLGALAAQGQSYYVVGTNTLTDLPFAVSQDFAVRFTDRDAIIARAGLPADELSITNVQSHIYGTVLQIPGLTALRGWISADVTTNGNAFRFVCTHLESSGGLYGNPDVDLVQAAQAAELATTFLGSPLPVAIAADFNSNATHTPPEQTLSFEIMLQAGYTDTWSAVHRGIPGFTWPMYLEDPLRPYPNGPFERIDFIFGLGIQPLDVDRTGLKKPWSSDHAGVVATLEFSPDR